MLRGKGDRALVLADDLMIDGLDREVLLHVCVPVGTVPYQVETYLGKILPVIAAYCWYP